MLQHHDIREFFSNKGLQVQQTFQAPFAHTSAIKVKSLKMLKFQIMHQQEYVHIAVTTLQHSDMPTLLHFHGRL